MQSERLERALQDGLWALPEGRTAVYRPRIGDDLSALPKERVVVLTGFKPDHDHFAALGYAVEPAAPYAAALVCLPRARAHARSLLAEASAAVVPGGSVVFDGQKTDGVEAIIKELRGLVALGEVLSKAHGKLASFPAGPELAHWSGQESQIEDGFVTLPGVFSADAADRGSMLLASLLPAKLGPKVVDLGAGWGYLSRQILARDGVKRLDLVEAERDALDCARRNVDDPRAQFHWADALKFRPESLVETVVMNPPFHTTRTAEPTLGLAFIAAARKMMAPDGVLYMVANRHLPYDDALEAAFLTVEQIGADSAFRVMRAAKPRRKS
ncbi:methyltransferase [Xinfangfangia sp. CPCC 101601]|uniref:Methyltransferase n=1 Tax=Pseudogemmobacter lacusdianii TaxID=3069608 RepID=A0ABU0VW20_9RHOB|nr:methyltransferase [Xinfangfangia sp. CPCC 101601]MDQ2065949.1 methyltransferase [Xinfangfangia sp. CPCC 101601]